MKAYVDQQECIGCAQCLDSCPVDAIHLKSGKAEIRDECIGCGKCIDKCPIQAITVK